MSPASLRTGHVGLNITELDRSIAFYQNVLGFDLLHRSDTPGRRFAFLGQGGELTLTLWQQSDGAFAERQPGLHHLAFEVPSVADVEAAEQRLQALGVEFQYEGIVPHAEGSDSGGIFFRDPDGIRLEVYTPSGVRAHAAVCDGPACGFF